MYATTMEPIFKTHLIFIKDKVEFTRMTEEIDCTDIGYSSQTLVFSDLECYAHAVKILEENNIIFIEIE